MSITKREFHDENGAAYTVIECTAVALAAGDTEADRQDALLVEMVVEHGQETFEHVVFGYLMPESDEDFQDMSTDGSAWDSDWETLQTVQVPGCLDFDEYRRN